MLDRCCTLHDRCLVLHLPVRQECWLCGNTYLMCHIKTPPSPLTKSKPHLMIPHNPISTGNTSADRYSIFQGRSGTPRNSTRTSFDGLKQYGIPHPKGTCPHACMRSIAVGDRWWLAARASTKPRCCRRACKSPRIPAVQVFPHLAMLRGEHVAKRHEPCLHHLIFNWPFIVVAAHQESAIEEKRFSCERRSFNWCSQRSFCKSEKLTSVSSTTNFLLQHGSCWLASS